ncbi:hypothetical protein [Enterococcus gallinarum]|uniref:hypothetical protein n=1 Tax=Enterococcus gallinarum TaxID=1353 RepID=UPI003D36C8B3
MEFQTHLGMIVYIYLKKGQIVIDLCHILSEQRQRQVKFIQQISNKTVTVSNKLSINYNFICEAVDNKPLNIAFLQSVMY